MSDDLQGMLIASHCMLLALVKKLVETEKLKPSDLLDATGDAEEILATLTPALMSSSARDYARRVLQQMGKIGPDSE
jgi:hypothetical protein